MRRKAFSRNLITWTHRILIFFFASLELLMQSFLHYFFKRIFFLLMNISCVPPPPSVPSCPAPHKYSPTPSKKECPKTCWKTFVIFDVVHSVAVSPTQMWFVLQGHRTNVPRQQNDNIDIIRAFPYWVLNWFKTFFFSYFIHLIYNFVVCSVILVYFCIHLVITIYLILINFVNKSSFVSHFYSKFLALCFSCGLFMAFFGLLSYYLVHLFFSPFLWSVFSFILLHG